MVSLINKANFPYCELLPSAETKSPVARSLSYEESGLCPAERGRTPGRRRSRLTPFSSDRQDRSSRDANDSEGFRMPLSFTLIIAEGIFAGSEPRLSVALNPPLIELSEADPRRNQRKEEERRDWKPFHREFGERNSRVTQSGIKPADDINHFK